jgi:hypothetical protein
LDARISSVTNSLDRLEPATLAALDLPADTKEVLSRGLPNEVALNSLMPTLFSSALSDGHIRSTPSESAVHGYVIGAIREQQMAPTDYSVFVIERGTGHVYVTDPQGD